MDTRNLQQSGSSYGALSSSSNRSLGSGSSRLDVPRSNDTRQGSVPQERRLLALEEQLQQLARLDQARSNDTRQGSVPPAQQAVRLTGQQQVWLERHIGRPAESDYHSMLYGRPQLNTNQRSPALQGPRTGFPLQNPGNSGGLNVAQTQQPILRPGYQNQLGAPFVAPPQQRQHYPGIQIQHGGHNVAALPQHGTPFSKLLLPYNYYPSSQNLPSLSQFPPPRSQVQTQYQQQQGQALVASVPVHGGSHTFAVQQAQWPQSDIPVGAQYQLQGQDWAVGLLQQPSYSYTTSQYQQGQGGFPSYSQSNMDMAPVHQPQILLGELNTVPPNYLQPRSYRAAQLPPPPGSQAGNFKGKEKVWVFPESKPNAELSRGTYIRDRTSQGQGSSLYQQWSGSGSGSALELNTDRDIGLNQRQLGGNATVAPTSHQQLRDSAAAAAAATSSSSHQQGQGQGLLRITDHINPTAGISQINQYVRFGSFGENAFGSGLQLRTTDQGNPSAVTSQINQNLSSDDENDVKLQSEEQIQNYVKSFFKQ